MHTYSHTPPSGVGAFSGSKRAVSGSGAEGGPPQDHGGRLGSCQDLGVKKGFRKIMDPPGGSLQDHPSRTRRRKNSHAKSTVRSSERALPRDQSCEKRLPADHRRERGLPERRMSDSDSESSDSGVVRWPTVPGRVRAAPNAAAAAATSADADEGELPKPPEAARKRTLSPPPVGWSWRNHVDKKLVVRLRRRVARPEQPGTA